ncbi:alpha/beta hydrolase family protein [Lentzea sp. NPDC051213]|uniref:alpha/beta hydrolase family protein n=1 Tax=Lentzea sp. NPDC051213 TaxID=3364126 RepID=UPI0037B292C7
MRRTVALLIPAMLAAVIPALPASAAPEQPSTPGWTVAGDVIRWTASTPMPLSDAGVEFWEGDRLLGTARESANLRTFTLSAKLKDPAALQVRSAGRRLDVAEPAPPASLSAPELPALQPEAAVDPGKPGPYATTTGDYTLDSIKLPDYAAPIEMDAVVVAPKGASGKRPLVLFLHGRHATCYSKTNPNQVTGQWPCPAGLTSIPSHRGYLKAQQLLASQGYVTVSISANGINAQDAMTADAGAQGRSSLVRHHLAKWAEWSAGRGSAPAVVKTAPADMSKVLLVGHSRGGEGVNRAATDSLSPPPGDTGFSGPVRWNIRGDVLIGPTIFGHNPAPDVPSVTFLPGCDGDVSDLQGQMFIDQTRGISRGAALHSALYMVGANHNFFNSEWTPGQAVAPANDDFWPGQQPDAVCAPGTATRLTADQQQTMGATYIAASTRLFLSRDESVLPLLDGSGVRAPSADPARVLSHAIGGDRKPAFVPDATTTVSGSARVCQQISRDAAVGCGGFRSPHFVGFRYASAQPERLSVSLQWSASGQAGEIRPAAPVSVRGSKQLALRLAVPANTPATSFGVSVTDQSGQKRSLGSVSVTGLPGTERTSSSWAQEVRVPLPAGLSEVAALELVPESASGQAWLIDAYGWNKGLVPVIPAHLGRVDATLTTVDEGNSGTHTHNIVVTASGNGTRVIRLFYNDAENKPATKLVTLKPGEHRAEVPVTYTANTRWGADTRYPVGVQAISNAVVGAAFGGLLVRNDDPAPVVSVVPVADSVKEGGSLTWKLTLSEAADSGVIFAGLPIAPAGATELSTTDVDAEWFSNNSGEEVAPSRPLSSTGMYLWIYIPPGQTSFEVTVPTLVDSDAEGEEQVRWKFEGQQPSGVTLEVTGKVADAA